MPMALEGIRILDWTMAQQGPVATMMLADMGAEVIKIEPPVRGDRGRGMKKIRGEEAEARGVNAYFEAHNRNKKSVTVDLTNGKGKEIIYRLAAKSDVFVHNFRVGSAERMGIGFEDLKKINPRIIYAHASGFGPEGPDRERGAIDPIAQARSGLISVMGEPDGPPIMVPAGMADQVGAMILAYGIMVALMARERLGIAQRVDTSLLGGQMFLQGLLLLKYTLCGQEPGRVSRYDIGPTYNSYRTKDGRWITVGLMQQKYWPKLCKALEVEGLEEDPRFSALDARNTNSKELIAVLDKIFATRTTKDWLERLERNGVTHGLVQNYSEAVSDPQVVENGYMANFNHPIAGPVQIVGIPVRLSETPGQLRQAAPQLGQHTEEVLLEIGGYSWDEIGRFREEGVI